MFEYSHKRPSEESNELSQDDIFSRREYFIDRQKQMLSKEKEYVNKINRLRNEAIEEIHSLIGPKKIERYLAFRKERSQRIAEFLSKYAPTPEGDRARERFSQQSVSTTQSFMKDLGVDVNKIRNINKAYQMRAKSLHDEYYKIDVNEFNNISLINPSEKEKLYSKDTGWEIVHPPYKNDSSSVIYDYKSKGINEHKFYTDYTTGTIGIDSKLDIDDAGDEDRLGFYGKSEISTYYKNHERGYIRVRAILDVIDKNVYNYAGCYKEWGYSNIYITQQLSAYLSIWSPRQEETHETIYYLFKDTDDTGGFGGIHYTPGSSIVVEFKSKYKYLEGEVNYSIGLCLENEINTNDMSALCVIEGKFNVSSIFISTTAE